MGWSRASWHASIRKQAQVPDSHLPKWQVSNYPQKQDAWGASPRFLSVCMNFERYIKSWILHRNHSFVAVKHNTSLNVFADFGKCKFLTANGVLWSHETIFPPLIYRFPGLLVYVRLSREMDGSVRISDMVIERCLCESQTLCRLSFWIQHVDCRVEWFYVAVCLYSWTVNVCIILACSVCMAAWYCVVV